MPRKKTRKPVTRKRPEDSGPRTCMWEGCGEEGLYPAPKSPRAVQEERRSSDLFWFCMKHVREYNQRWDYFRGMSDAEILRFKEEAILGHRPTWKMGIQGRVGGKARRARPEELMDAVERFAFLKEEEGLRYPPDFPKEGKDALAALELSFPVTMKEIKTRHRELVKRFHPDLNHGKKGAEERFKAISEAYHYLKNCGYFLG